LKLHSITIRNYCCFEDLTLELGGSSLILVGPNSSGKSTLLEATRLALHGGVVNREDFRDVEQPIEITATLGGIPAEQQGLFAEAIDFNQTPPVLRVGLQSIWDEEEREPKTSHAFPDAGWRRVSRAARETIPLIHLPAWRDPARQLALTGNRSLLAGLIAGLPIEEELEQTIAAIKSAAETLSEAEPLRELLADGNSQLARLLAGLPEEPFSLGPGESDTREVLRQLRLLLSLEQGRVSIGSQSGGIGQASIFAFLLRALAVAPESIVLIDEPENTLHPHAQRALLTALSAEPVQSLLTTHSAAVLDRRDPQEITRISRDRGAGAELHRAGGLSDEQARALRRYSTSLTAEAYFAETVVLVEGFSDFLAIRALATTLGVNLDGAGVTLLSLEGADLVVHYLRLFGPSGLDLNLHGLCDLDHEEAWRGRLEQVGIPAPDLPAMNAAGFYVCDPDLEAELLGALDEQQIEALIAEEGAEAHFASFSQKDLNAGLSTSELQLHYVKSQKIRWAPLVAAAIEATRVPTPIRELIESL
jgi:ABC-type cobalamin/Fe3+-siderophores transport system ATPase subunit